MEKIRIRDLALPGDEGTTVEQVRYGYYGRDYFTLDGSTVMHRKGDRDSWVILCTVPGAIGPFTATREVTRGPWVLDPRDGLSDGEEPT